MSNNTRVSQGATGEYAVHQFKDYIGSSPTATLTWEGQTNCSPTLSTVYLQVYDQVGGEWETVDSDDSSDADTDFELTAEIADTTNYIGDGGILSCRVYQLAV